MKLALVAEGTYPYAMGGVSVWCDQLIRGLPDATWQMVTLTVDGTEPSVWTIPDNVECVRSIPLWSATSGGYHRAASDPAFAGAYGTFVDALLDGLGSDPTPEHTAARRRRFLAALEGLWQYADDGGALGEALLSNTALTMLLESWRASTDEAITLADALDASWLVSRMLRPLAADPVEVDIVHSSMNGLCMLVGMAAKWRYGTPVIMSEHGIYLRERYLSFLHDDSSRAVRILLLRFYRSLAEAGYLISDALAPHSNYNRRWQLRNGARESRMWTMYNGVSPDDFVAADSEPDTPTIVFTGRIDPLKDLHTLIRAFAEVRTTVPDARLRIFGGTPAGNEPYRESCQALITELGVGDAANLEGRVDSPVDAYHAGSIAALTSISEGFPYAVVEAMACGRAVVSTNVGGVAEAIADTGIVVPPRDHSAVAKACITLLTDDALRHRSAAAARARMMEMFTLERSLSEYRALYEHVLDGRELHDGGSPVDQTSSGNPPGWLWDALRQHEVETLPHRDPDEPDEFDLIAAAVPGSVSVGVDGDILVGAHTSGVNVRHKGWLWDLLRLHDASQARPRPEPSLPALPAASGADQRHGGTNGHLVTIGGSGGTAAAVAAPATAVAVAAPVEVEPEEVAARARRLDELVAAVGEVAEQTVDDLQVTAMLEADGVTDEIASCLYGFGDVFELAGQVRRRVLLQRGIAPVERTVTPTASTVRDLSHGLLYLLPAAVFPAIIAALDKRALVLGVVIAGAVGWVWAGASAWLAYRLTGRAQHGSAASLLQWTALLGVPVAAAASVAVVTVMSANQLLVVLATAMMAYQMASTILLFYKREAWLAAAMTPAVLIGIAYTAGATSLLQPAIYVGACCVLLSYGLAVGHTAGIDADGEPSVRDGLRGQLGEFPLVLAYTALSAAFLLHAQGRFMLTRFDIIAAVLPLMVGMGVVEWRVHSFNDAARHLLVRLGRPAQFVSQIKGVLARNVAFCVAASAVVGAGLLGVLWFVGILSAAGAVMCLACVLLSGAYFIAFLLANMNRYGWLCASLGTALALHLAVTAAAGGQTALAGTTTFLGSVVALFVLLIVGLGDIGDVQLHR